MKRGLIFLRMVLALNPFLKDKLVKKVDDLKEKPLKQSAKDWYDSIK